MQDKVNLLRRDEFGVLVVMRAVANLIRAACLQVPGPVEVRMEDARFPEWDDLTVAHAVDGERRIESWQVKNQTTPFSQDLFSKLLRSLRSYPEIAAWHLLLRDLVDVEKVGNLRILRALCDRLSGRGLDLEVLPATLDSKTRRWLEFVKQSLGSTEEEALRFLSRLEIETVISERDLKDRVLEKLGTVYQDPETAYARLREYLRENLDSAGRITWELIERCAEAGHRLTPTQSLLRSEIELLEPDPRPGDLLRAGSRVLSFHGRTEQLQEFERWLQSDPSVSLMLFTGAGGTGKTRLLIEWCRRLRLRGEVAGFLPRHLDASQLRQLAHARERRVIAVDYAETRTDALRELLELAVEEPQLRGPLRLVLLARREGEWWSNLGQESLPVKRLIERQGRVWNLGALASDVSLRRQLFDEALERFADLRKLPKPAQANADLSAAHFAHPLYLQMAALATLEGHTEFQAVELLDSTLDHEKRYWAHTMNALGHSPPDLKIVKRGFYGMMTLATLWSGLRTRELGRERLSKLTGMPAARSDLIESVLELLEELYGGTRAADGTWVRGLEPDLLGEYFVAEQLEKKGELLGAAFDVADDEECRSALIVLTRLADRQPERMRWLQEALTERLERLGEIAVSVAAEVGDPLGIVLMFVARSEKDLDLLQRLIIVSSKGTALLEFRTEVRSRIVAAAKLAYSKMSEEEKESLAQAVGSFAEDLQTYGATQRALEECEYALGIYRELSPSNDEKFGSIVTQLLLLRGTVLWKVARTTEGLKANSEAIALARKLVTTNPGRFSPLLGRCLNNYADHLLRSSELKGALLAIEESVTIRRRVLAASPDSESAASELSFSLSTQSRVLAAKNRVLEALPIAAEALDLTQALADKNPEAFLPKVASRLTVLAAHLMTLGRANEAFPSLVEAADIRRKLSRYRPAIFLPELANTLQVMSGYFRDARKMMELMEVDAELVSIYQVLKQLDPEKNSEALAVALYEQSQHLVLAGREEDAIKAEEESLAIYRELATARLSPFRPKLANALNSFSVDLRQWNRLDAAVTTAMESVELYRTLSETADEYRKQRVLPLENLFLALERIGGREKDLESVLLELEEVHTQLASKSPATPDPKRFWALSKQAEFFARLSRHEKAIVAYQKAVEVVRQLSPSVHQKRALAAFLNDLAGSATMAGQPDKSLPALRESLEILRALTADAPGQHELELGLGLNSLAALLHSREERRPACAARKEGLQYLAAVLAATPEPDALACLPSYLEAYRQEAAEAGVPVDEALLAKLGTHLSTK